MGFVKWGDRLWIIVCMCMCGTPARCARVWGSAGACKRAKRGTPRRIMCVSPALRRDHAIANRLNVPRSP